MKSEVSVLIILGLVALCGCASDSYVNHPLSDGDSTRDIRECGIGVVVFAPAGTSLTRSSWPYSRETFSEDTYLVGTVVRLYPRDAYNSVPCKLVGRKVCVDDGAGYFLGNCSWRTGTVGDYARLSPLPAVNDDLSKRLIKDDSGIDDAKLIELASNSDWVIRYYAIQVLVAGKSQHPQLRRILDEYPDERVELVSTVMQSGRYRLYADVRPSFDR